MSFEKISIVVPVHNEQENIKTLAEEIFQVSKELNYPYEVIIVNDGSLDKTWEAIEKCCNHYPNFIGIDLGGNFGQSIALRCGFENSSGDVIIFMDGDLQHNPSDIPRLLDKMEEGYDMVGGYKQVRPEGFYRKKLSQTAHWLIKYISKADMKYFGATFRTYRRFLLENTNILKDTHRFLGAILAKKGIRQTEIPINIRGRNAGASHYKASKLFSVIIDLIFLKFTVSYMNKPFRLFGFIGLVMFLVGFISSIYILTGSIFRGFNIRVDYLSEFLFSIFLILIAVSMISFGFVAEIGIYNYYSGGSISPYSIRKKTK